MPTRRRHSVLVTYANSLTQMSPFNSCLLVASAGNLCKQFDSDEAVNSSLLVSSAINLCIQFDLNEAV